MHFLQELKKASYKDVVNAFFAGAQKGRVCGLFFGFNLRPKNCLVVATMST